ncbi:MAG: HAD-IA family hydrolase [Streptosporangiales bacterium]|nr:HAD-IA family hydrolase [Streptosporangiales bacterium]
MIKAVAFDIGETLIDETRIWSRWADRLGVTRLTFLGLLGAMAAADRPISGAFEIVAPGFDVDAELAAWAAEDPDGLRENFDAADLYPDVRDCLAALRAAGLRVVIAGNQPPQAGPALERMDLGADLIATSAGWGVSKPEPEFFARTVEACGCASEEVLYVGDRLDNDVLPATAAGLGAVLLRRGPWGYLHATRPAATRATAILDDLTALPALARDQQIGGRIL